MCKTYRECKANAPRKEGSLSCRKKGAELSRHTHLICFIFLHNSGCDGCDKYKVWLQVKQDKKKELLCMRV